VSTPDTVDWFFDPLTSSDEETGSDSASSKFFSPIMSCENSIVPKEATYAQLYPSTYVWIKLVYEDDTAILRFPRKGLSLKKLRREVFQIHNRELRLKYQDCEGDSIQVKSNEFLNYALHDWQEHFEHKQRLMRMEAIN
jgi:hypothetical protein